MKVQLWAKRSGIKFGLIASITHIGNLGTWWEHQDPKKWYLQPPSPKEKKSVSSPPRHQKLGKTQLHMHISFNPKKKLKP
jgi:hypothetical protein